MRALAGVLVASSAIAVAHAHPQHVCPAAGQGGRQAAVDHRHQESTGVPTQGTLHRFLLTPEGGSIELTASDDAPADARDLIRAHLKSIARSFAAGDFSLPTRIHGQVPPGADAMEAHKAAITYAYADRPAGGVVTVSTKDAAALAAVHEFLRFQIRDHGTGDPTE